MIYSPDVFETSRGHFEVGDYSGLRRLTFFDVVSSGGFRVCVIFPHTFFPAWKIHGVMVCRSPGGELDSYPPDIARNPEFKNLQVVSGKFPGIKRLPSYAEKVFGELSKEGNLAVTMAKREKWDLFFVYFAWLDILEHYFWRFFDPADPLHVQSARLGSIIPEAYRLLDGCVTRLAEAADGAALMVISDHGHKRRPYSTVNINALLRQRGWLALGNKTSLGPTRLIEHIKKIVLRTAKSAGFEELLVTAAAHPALAAVSKDLYTSSSVIDKRGTVACLSTFVGPKTYSYGGIALNAVELSPSEVTELEDSIIRELMAFRDRRSGRTVVKWVRRRAELYSASEPAIYPHLLFRLDDDYGVGWSVTGPILDTSYEHKLASGGHSFNSFCMASGMNLRTTGTPKSVLDIAPTVLDFFGCRKPPEYEGETLLQP